MAKRSHDGHSTQLVALAMKPTTPSAIPPHNASPTPGSQSDAEGYQGTLRASSFWVQEGMDTFFDWIANPYNHERLHQKNPASGQKLKDIRQEIANVVNNKHIVKWTELQVKSKIAYVKSKYREAAKLNSTGQGAHVTAKQLAVCPEFTRLHKVYGRSLSTNPSPPRQSVHVGDERATFEITDDESSDLEPQEDISDAETHAGSQARPFNAFPSNKRRRGNGVSSPVVLTTSFEKIQQLSDQRAYDETRTKLRQREQAVEIRESDLLEKFLRLMENSNRLAEEARVRLRQELTADRAEFKKEMAEEKVEFKREKAEFKREKAEFAMERDQLKMENAALRAELEVRTVMRPKNY
ncbi:MAG: hypothetical protein J3R72DRAFT_17491 [Linnemannia gamsii]|nr:MAG: hypothetical protein J3R72DRAFT_17491 [Linnemannia gamsii]